MIVALVGYISSGKDTVASHFVDKGFVRDSFAGPLKDTCSAVFGWPRDLLEGNTVASREFRETPDMFWARKLGIDHFTPRLALQLMGTDVMRNHFHADIWLNSLEYRFRKAGASHNMVISDARFRNELDLVKQLDGKIIWVQRGELPEWYDTAASANTGNAVDRKIMQTRWRDVHESEWNWAGYEVDYVIDNTGSLEDLHRNIDVVMERLHIAQPILQIV